MEVELGVKELVVSIEFVDLIIQSLGRKVLSASDADSSVYNAEAIQVTDQTQGDFLFL